MAQLSFAVTRIGLEVPVWIGLDGKTTATLLAAGQPIPSPVAARGLLDCGSDLTAVAPWVLRQLRIPVAARSSTVTAAGTVPVNLLEISLSILGPTQAGGPLLTHPDLIVTELATALPATDVLVGLNVLLRQKLFLDGPARQFTLDF